MSGLGIIPYSVDRNNHVVLLLWKLSVASLHPIESSQFWSCLYCPLEIDDGEKEEQERVSLRLSQMCGGTLYHKSFNGGVIDIESRRNNVARMENALLKRLRKRKGVISLLKTCSLRILLVPVKFVMHEVVNLHTTEGFCKWLELRQFLSDASPARMKDDINLALVAEMSNHLESLLDLEKRASSEEIFDSSAPETSNLLSVCVEESKSIHRYCCFKCRKTLFQDFSVIEHEKGGGQTSFAWNKRNEGREQGCLSYFLDYYDSRISHLLDTNAVEGKINCIHCSFRIGSFKLSGIQCSCGAWVAPAVKIGKVKVDKREA